MRCVRVLLPVAVCASAQTAAFEAVSIHLNTGPGGPSSIRVTPGRVSMSNVNVRKMILNAYGIPDDREYALAGPDWMGTERFDVEATFPAANMNGETIRAMLKAMLEERFKLALHRETRQLPVYSLVVAKGGAKIQPAGDGESKTSSQPGHFVATKITMRKFADLIAREARRPVSDATGLSGVFVFTLEWSPTAGLRVETDGSASNPSEGPSIFTALQEQLGLKLESGKGPVEVLVIDRIDRPSGN